jgi:aminopeptidase YwaD
MPARAGMDCLNRSGLAAAIYVDHRYRSEWPMALGLPEMWADRPGLPMFSVPFGQAWDLVASGRAVRVKLLVASRLKRLSSANALGDLPGADARLAREIVYVSGHVDSVRGSVGGDDDASGTALMLEIARMLSESPLKRTVRFVGYGVEERLSAGAYNHFRNRARNGMAHAVFGFNADSVGTHMGLNHVSVAGPAGLKRLVQRVMRRTGYVGDVVEEVNPYSDQFPLNMLGAPTVWLYRKTHPIGNWFFHSTYDSLEAVSEGVIAEQARFVAALLRAVGDADPLPFRVELPAKRRRETAAFARDFHGLDLQTAARTRAGG